MTTGTYTLLIELSEPSTIEVGALGAVSFDRECYAYTGSAFGPGGLGRVDRHRELAAGDRDARHWHVDYLLGHPAARIDGVWTSPGADRECAVACDLPGESVPEFGASDCDCESHLTGIGDRAALVAALDELHEQQGR